MFRRVIFPILAVFIFYAFIAMIGILITGQDFFAFYAIKEIMDQANFFNDAEYADIDTEDFIYYGITPALITLNFITALALSCWFLFGEFTGIQRPGEAQKFLFVWISIYLVQVVLFITAYYYFLHFNADVDGYMKVTYSASALTLSIIINFILFFILSLFLSSRVLKPALPTSFILSLYYRIKGASS